MWDRQCRIILLLIKVIIGLIFFIPSIAIASSPFLEDIRLNTEKGSTRIVLEHSHSIKYDLTEDIKQKKIIVQLSQTHYKAHFLKKLNALALKNSPIKKLVLNNKNNKLYVIIYLKNRQLTKIYKLAANKKQKNRIVIDLTNIPTESVAKSLSKITNTLTPKPIPYKNKIIKNNKKFIIAIDAGHGGSDPGAIGRSGLREKDVVIKIAKYLKKLLDKEPNLQAVLIRQGDYYVGLQDRVRFARGKKADLFISIHADAFHNRRAEGASVFTLSENGASSTAAKWLADRENKTDLIGGINLGKQKKYLAEVLLDLTQTASKSSGLTAANHILRALSKVTKLHRKHVEQAAFAVLKAPDIPSILVETGFISNPRIEAKLKTSFHQKKIAQALSNGIKSYFDGKLPTGYQLKS